MGQEPRDLFRFPRLRQREQEIVAPQRPEVAVHGLGRMQEVAWCAGRSERGGNLAGDEARLADPRHHDAAGTALNQPHGAAKRIVETLRCLHDRITLGAENLPPVRKQVGVRRRGGRRGVVHGGAGL